MSNEPYMAKPTGLGGGSLIGYVCKKCISRILKDKLVKDVQQNPMVNPQIGNAGQTQNGGPYNNVKVKNAQTMEASPDDGSEEYSDYYLNKDYLLAEKMNKINAEVNKITIDPYSTSPTCTGDTIVTKNLSLNSDNKQGTKCLICGSALKILLEELRNKNVLGTGSQLAHTYDSIFSTLMDIKQLQDKHSCDMIGKGKFSNLSNAMKRNFAVSMLKCPMCDRNSVCTVDTCNSPPREIGGDSGSTHTTNKNIKELMDNLTDVQNFIGSKALVGFSGDHHGPFNKISNSQIISEIQRDSFNSNIPIKMKTLPQQQSLNIKNQGASLMMNSPKNSQYITFPRVEKTSGVQSPAKLSIMKCPLCHHSLNTKQNIASINGNTSINKRLTNIIHSPNMMGDYVNTGNTAPAIVSSTKNVRLKPSYLPPLKMVSPFSLNKSINYPIVLPQQLRYTVPYNLAPPFTQMPQIVGILNNKINSPSLNFTRLPFLLTPLPPTMIPQMIFSQPQNLPIRKQTMAPLNYHSQSLMPLNTSFYNQSNLRSKSDTNMSKVCPTCMVPYTPASSLNPSYGSLTSLSKYPTIYPSFKAQIQAIKSCPTCGVLLPQNFNSQFIKKTPSLHCTPAQCPTCKQTLPFTEGLSQGFNSLDRLRQSPMLANNYSFANSRYQNQISVPVTYKTTITKKHMSNSFNKTGYLLPTINENMCSYYPNQLCPSCNRPLSSGETVGLNHQMPYNCNTCGLPKDLISNMNNNNNCAACNDSQIANVPSNNWLNPSYERFPSTYVPSMYNPRFPQSLYATQIYPNAYPLNNSIANLGLPIFPGGGQSQDNTLSTGNFYNEDLAKLLIHLINLIHNKSNVYSVDEILAKSKTYFEGVIEFSQSKDGIDSKHGILKSENNSAVFNSLQQRLKEKGKFVYKKVDPLSEFENCVRHILSLYISNPNVPRSEILYEAKQLFKTAQGNNKDINSIARDCLAEVNIANVKSDIVAEILITMRRCLMYHTDLTLRNVVELAYILYINLQEARRSGKFRQDIQVSVNSNRVTNKEDIQREIVSNVCNLQQRYPCVTPRTIMMYCLDLFKKFQEGPLIPLSSRIDGSTNYGNLGGSHFGNLGDGMQSMGDNAELMGALNDLKNSTRDLKHNAERFDDLMHILDRKGDLAKVAIKKVQPDKTIKLSQHKSRTNKKGKDQKINKEYIIEYFKNEKAESPYYGGGSPGAYEKDYVYEAETAPAPKGALIQNEYVF